LLDAERAWAVTKDTTSPAVLTDFIRQFGKTPYGSMARARLKELQAAAAPKQPDKVVAVTAPAETVSAAATLTGHWRVAMPNPRLIGSADVKGEMSLVQSASGEISGELKLDRGSTFRIKGKINGGRASFLALSGNITDDYIFSIALAPAGGPLGGTVRTKSILGTHEAEAIVMSKTR
jgi:hypothetical protein